MKIYLLMSVCCITGVVSYFITRQEGVADEGKPEATPFTVTMKSLSYEPKRVEIRVGDSIVWTNDARTEHNCDLRTAKYSRKTIAAKLFMYNFIIF